MVALQIVPGVGERCRALSKAYTRLRSFLGLLKCHTDVARLAAGRGGGTCLSSCPNMTGIGAHTEHLKAKVKNHKSRLVQRPRCCS